MSIQQERFKQIADAIREKTNDTDLIKPIEFADKISDVYDAGYDEGYNEGCNTFDSNEYDLGYINGRNTMIRRELTSIDDETLTSLGGYAFAGMSLTSVNLPNVASISKYSFRGCSALTEIDLPSLTTIHGKGEHTFAYCGKVIRYNLPNLRSSTTDTNTGVLMSTFVWNYSLERIELLNHIVIGDSCFLSCQSLKALVLGESATLQHTNAFRDTPINNGTGYIYVPDDKVATFKTATNWVAFASQIKGYSELPTEMNTLTFTVNDVEYTAPIGTWENFINSAYNDGTFEVLAENGSTYVVVDGLTVFLGLEIVDITDNIIADYPYRLVEYGGEL